MSIDKDKIKHVSKLARISVDENKIDSLTKDLSSIFKFIEQLNELNTDKVEPLSSILNEPLRSRKDEINDGKIREKILKNSPKKNEEFFVVPKVIE
jgi:aspartyl-tRNA(Asn)/glutamyl-tRNA(Gln) amidotransferase subunit C